MYMWYNVLYSVLHLSLPSPYLSSLEEFHLAECDTEAHTTGLLGECSAETHTQPVQDFGHSLFAGSVTNVHCICIHCVGMILTLYNV